MEAWMYRMRSYVYAGVSGEGGLRTWIFFINLSYAARGYILSACSYTRVRWRHWVLFAV